MKPFSLHLRIWHWLNAIAVFGLLGTFFLRKTFLSWRDNQALIIEKMAEFNIDITAVQAKQLAQAIRAPMWEWHYIFGIAFAVLLLWRLIMIYTKGFEHDSTLPKMQWIYRGYKLLYLIFIAMALSGLSLYLKEYLGLPKELLGIIKEAHELVAWTLVAFVPLHIAGVFIADNTDQKGLTSKMVSG